MFSFIETIEDSLLNFHVVPYCTCSLLATVIQPACSASPFYVVSHEILHCKKAVTIEIRFHSLPKTKPIKLLYIKYVTFPVGNPVHKKEVIVDNVKNK